MSRLLPLAQPLVRLDADAYPYDHFLGDCAEAEERAQASEPTEVLHAIAAYFTQRYGIEAGSHRFLRFGAVQAALGLLWEDAERLGLCMEGDVHPFLVQQLLTAPLVIQPETQEVWISQGEAREAVRRAARVVRQDDGALHARSAVLEQGSSALLGESGFSIRARHSRVPDPVQ